MKFSKYAAAEWSKLEDKTEWEALAEADKEDYAYEVEEQRASEVSFAIVVR
jgi:hypothetical protein